MEKKKSLGQNFLKSTWPLKVMVEAGRVENGDTVLEIGPGEGVLTEVLLHKGAKVIAVEKDDRLIPVLQSKFAAEISSGKLELMHGDILEFNVSDLMLHFSSYKLIANIPYYISGAIFEKFLSALKQPSLMVLLVQREVARRIVANDKKESILSISVKAYGKPSYIETVKAREFRPEPKVDSAIILIDDISKKLFIGLDEAKFFTLVKTGFAHKRKQLAGNLKEKYEEKILDMFNKLNISPKTRAEDLPLEKWLELAKNL